MSFAEVQNKIRIIFSLFDFDNNHSLDQDEFILMLVIFLECWARLSKTKLPERQELIDFAKALYGVRNGKITVTEVGLMLERYKEAFYQLRLINGEIVEEFLEETKTFLPIVKSKIHFKVMVESKSL